jgi:carbamoyltransferase
MSIIVGINAYHGDSSACLVRDGRLIAAAEEERFRRIKHWAGFPSEAIRYCLHEAGVKPEAVEHLAINRNPRVNNFRRLGYILKRRPDLRLVLSRLRNISKASTVDSAMRAAFPAPKSKPGFIVSNITWPTLPQPSGVAIPGGRLRFRGRLRGFCERGVGHRTCPHHQY